MSDINRFLPESMRILKQTVQEKLNYCDSVARFTSEHELFTITNSSSGDNREHHIITNELANYDSIPVVALSISNNIRSGIKYYYYVSDDYSNEHIELFKEEIKKYYERTAEARLKVVAWIRQEIANTINMEQFEEFFNATNCPAGFPNITQNDIKKYFEDKYNGVDNKNVEASEAGKDVPQTGRGERFDYFVMWMKSNPIEFVRCPKELDELLLLLSEVYFEFYDSIKGKNDSKKEENNFKNNVWFKDLRKVVDLYTLYKWQELFDIINSNDNAYIKRIIELMGHQFTSEDTTIIGRRLLLNINDYGIRRYNRWQERDTVLLREPIINWLLSSPEKCNYTVDEFVTIFSINDSYFYNQAFNFDYCHNCTSEAVHACWYTSTRANEKGKIGGRIDCDMISCDVRIADAKRMYSNVIQNNKIIYDSLKEKDSWITHSLKECEPKAFIAMQFNKTGYKEKEKEALINSIKNESNKAGFGCINLDEESADKDNDSIDDNIKNKIQSCTFVIADVTFKNNGVYFEQGFAKGIGKPVIQICKSEKIRGIHTDTSNNDTITWRFKDGNVSFDGKLTARIKNTIPGASKGNED